MSTDHYKKTPAYYPKNFPTVSIVNRHDLFKDIDNNAYNTFSIKCKIKGKEYSSSLIIFVCNQYAMEIQINLPPTQKTIDEFKLEKEYDIDLDMEQMIEPNKNKKTNFSKKFTKCILVNKQYNPYSISLFFAHQLIKLNSTAIRTFINKEVQDIITQTCKEVSVSVKTNIKSEKIPFIIQYYRSYYDFLEYLMSHYKAILLPKENGTITINTLDSFTAAKAVLTQERDPVVLRQDRMEQINTFSYVTKDFDINNPLKPIELKKENNKNIFTYENKTFDIHKNNKSHFSNYVKRNIPNDNLEFCQYFYCDDDLQLYNKISINKKTFFIYEKIFISHKFTNSSDAYKRSFRYILVPNIPIVPTKDYKIHNLIHGIIWDKDNQKKHTSVYNKPKDSQHGSFPVCLVETDLHKDKKNIFFARNLQTMCNEKGGLFLPHRHGDEVLVGFIDGLPTKPVIFGSLWNNRSLYPVQKNTNLQGLIVSNMEQKDQMSLLFDPTNNKEAIETKFIQHYNILSTDNNFFHKCQVKDKKTKIDNYIKDATITNKYEKLNIEQESDDLNIQEKIKKGKVNITLEEGDVVYNIKKGDITIKLDKGNLNLDITKSDVNLDCGDIVTIKSKKQIVLDSEELVLKASKKISLETQDLEIKAPKSLKLETMKLDIKATKTEIKSASGLKVTAAKIEMTGMTKITGPCDIQGTFALKGPATITGNMTVTPMITCSMFTGNLMGNAMTATKAITASSLG